MKIVRDAITKRILIYRGKGRGQAVLIPVCCVCAALVLSSEVHALDIRQQPLSTQSFANYAIGEDRVLRVWGEDFCDPDGNRRDSYEEACPILENAVFVAAGWNGALAIDMRGTLWGWGNYRLGDAHNQAEDPPMEPHHILDNTVDAAAGLSHYLALCSDGTLYGGGHNQNDQLTGNGPQGDDYSHPVPILTKVRSISTDCNDASFAVLDNNELVFWGTMDEVQSPTPISLSGEAQQLFPGGQVLLNDGTLCSITTEKRLNTEKIVLEPILKSVRAVFQNAAQTSDGKFWVWSAENQQFQKLSIGSDAAYMDSTSDEILIKTENGSIRRIPIAEASIKETTPHDARRSDLSLSVFLGSGIFLICAGILKKRAAQ